MKISVKKEVIFKEDEEGNVILVNFYKEDDNFYKISGVAKEVWKGLMEGHELGKITENILAEYDVEKEKVEEDTKRFIEELKSFDLITIEE